MPRGNREVIDRRARIVVSGPPSGLLHDFVKYVVYDRNAAVATARCFSAQDPWQDCLDWQAIDSSDFRYDAMQPDRKHKQQAECLVHGAVPNSALLGFVCCDEPTKEVLQNQINQADTKTNVF